ncbi:sigma-70 family RNA polymerase sigma factor [Robertmurraya massiliosenegalensis]|uniref:sigma-70 family RNA polymerase sigma factor n=1 Tax=Robertmurraya TaxID=2837507 RepID=UPI0039A6956E
MNIDKSNEQIDHTDYLIGELIELYGQQIQRIIYSFVKDQYTSEDLTQETFISAYQSLREYRGDSKVYTWLYRIAINKAKDHLKSTWLKRVYYNLPEQLKSIDSTELTVINKITELEIIDKILSLPIKYREVILLYYIEEFSVKEISGILNLQEDTIRTRMRRARRQLSKILKEGNHNE